MKESQCRDIPGERNNLGNCFNFLPRQKVTQKNWRLKIGVSNYTATMVTLTQKSLGSNDGKEDTLTHQISSRMPVNKRNMVFAFQKLWYLSLPPQDLYGKSAFIPLGHYNTSSISEISLILRT